LSRCRAPLSLRSFPTRRSSDLLGGFDPKRTYVELASFAHRRVGRIEWPLLRVPADAIVANSFGSNLLALRNRTRLVYWVHSTRRSEEHTSELQSPDPLVCRLLR